MARLVRRWWKYSRWGRVHRYYRALNREVSRFHAVSQDRSDRNCLRLLRVGRHWRLHA